jgi:hypothetical protein
MKTNNLNAGKMNWKDAGFVSAEPKAKPGVINKIFLITALMLSPGFLSSQDASAQPSGQEIMEKVYHNPSGDDVEGRLTMTLIKPPGGEACA